LNIKKIKEFQEILKKHHKEELHKKGTILHQAPQITLFLNHPVYMSAMAGATAGPNWLKFVEEFLNLNFSNLILIATM